MTEAACAASDKRLRYRVVNATDQVGLRIAAADLSRRARTKAGVYVIIDGAGAPSKDQRLRWVLNGTFETLYIGSSSQLGHRASQLRCGLVGTNPRHGFSRFYFQELVGKHRLEDLAMILIPFSPAYCLERFLIEEHLGQYGSYPAGNQRRAGRTSARLEEPWVPVSWPSLLGPSRPPCSVIG